MDWIKKDPTQPPTQDPPSKMPWEWIGGGALIVVLLILLGYYFDIFTFNEQIETNKPIELNESVELQQTNEDL